MRGYTVANDVSARDLQFADGQWVRGKSLDTFCPLGPEVVALDDPQNLKLATRVNGEVDAGLQHAEMVFGVAELISFCSHSFTLEPGDVILTGTPWGCGEFMDPKRSLEDGDVVECEIEGIGVLRNPVVEVYDEVHVPESVDEVVALLGEGVLLAGGTHVMPRAHATRVDSSACATPGWPASRTDGEVTDRRGDDAGAGRARASPFLRDAIESIASPTIRNLATVGGNLFVPQPHGDFAVCLLALDAEVTSSTRRRGDASTSTGARHQRALHDPGALVLHEGDAAQAELGLDRHRRQRRRADRARRRRAAAGARARRRGGARRAATSRPRPQPRVEAADPFDDAYASAWYRRRVLPVHVRASSGQCRPASSNSKSTASRASSSPRPARRCCAPCATRSG